MTQIVDDRLKKMCNKCQSMFDKPCAWLSLGNEYCDEIMDIQRKIDQLTNNQNELEEWLKQQKNKNFVGYVDGKEFYLDACFNEVLDKMKEIKEGNE